MPVIKFSHRYSKMPRDYQLSRLLEVLSIKLEDLSIPFRGYDTSFEVDGVTDFYPLPAKGAYMILLLQAGSGNGNIWTTIRSQRGQGGLDKLTYYKSRVGEIFECVITG